VSRGIEVKFDRDIENRAPTKIIAIMLYFDNITLN